MKKWMIAIAVVAVAAATVFATTATFAQGQGPGNPPGPWPGGRGDFGPSGDGLLHNYIIAALADALGISAVDLEARLENGETFYQIALDLGFENDQIRGLMVEAHQAALEQAVADGVIEEGQFPQDGPGFSRGVMGFNGEGVLHDYVTSALADALGISTADLEARLENGETFYQIALDLGFDNGQVRDLMIDARQAAFEQAVADGVIEEGQFPQGGPGFGRGGPFGGGRPGGFHPWSDPNQDGE